MAHISLRGTAHGKFHDKDGKPYEKKKQKIDTEKNGTTVFTCYIRKTPNITKADGTTGRKKDKTKTAGELLTLGHKKLS